MEQKPVGNKTNKKRHLNGMRHYTESIQHLALDLAEKTISEESAFLKNKLYVGDKQRSFDGNCYITMTFLRKCTKWKEITYIHQFQGGYNQFH